MAQVSGGVQFRVCCLVSSYWVQSITELQFAGFCVVSNYWGTPFCKVLSCARLLGECTVLHQAIEELPLQDSALCQDTEDFQLVRHCFAPSYWGSAISRLLPCVKQLENYHLQGFALRQAIGNYNVQGLALRRAIE